MVGPCGEQEVTKPNTTRQITRRAPVANPLGMDGLNPAYGMHSF